MDRIAGRSSQRLRVLIGRPISHPERGAGANQQSFGGMHGASEVLGDLRDRQTVEVAQGQRGPVVRAQRVEHLMGRHGVDLDIPRVVALADGGVYQAACGPR